MTISNILILIAFVLALFLFLNSIINYIARRDREEQPSMHIKLWLIPILSLLIIVPIAGFTFLYGLFFYSFEQMTDLIQFKQSGDMITFSLVILIGLLFFDTFVHPIVVNLMRYFLNREISIYSKSAVTIVVDSLIIYFLANVLDGVYVKDFLSSLSISVIYHIIEWLLTGFYQLYKRMKKH